MYNVPESFQHERVFINVEIYCVCWTSYYGASLDWIILISEMDTYVRYFWELSFNNST